MARKLKNKQSQPSVSGSDLKNIKKQTKKEVSKDPGSGKGKTRYGRSLDSLRLEDGLAEFARQLVLPIDTAHPVVSPSNYPTQVCSRHIHRVVDVSSATPAYANGFTVIMKPDLYAPGMILTPAATAIPSVAGLVSFSGEIENNLKSVHGDVLHTSIACVDTTGETTHVKLHQIPDAVGTELVGLNLTPAAHDTRLSIHNKYGSPIQWEMWSKVVGGNWAKIYQLSTQLGAYETADVQHVMAANVDAIGFRITGTTVAVAVKIAMVFENSQVVGNTGETFSPAFQKFVIDNDVTHARVVSMSILATNTSPEIADGGNINAGRVPKNFSPFVNVATSLAALPTNRRYQSRAKDGAYVTWVPSQFDEFEVDTVANKVEQLRDAEYLIVEVSGWNPPAGSTASFRLQFDWIIEFYTPNQLFEKFITPPSSPAFQSLYHRILCMDAATCNPGHLDQLKKLVSSGISGLNSGIQFYNEHEKLIQSVLTLLSKMLI